MEIFPPQTPAEDRHFPLPHSVIDLVENHYDPTYGDSTSTLGFLRCSTCAAIVLADDRTAHAEWHDRMELPPMRYVMSSPPLMSGGHG